MRRGLSLNVRFAVVAALGVLLPGCFTPPAGEAPLRYRDNLPGVAVSDAHSILEVGVAYSALDGDPSTPAGLLSALATVEIVPGRATYAVRLWTPLARTVNRMRGNGRIRPGAPA